MSNFDEDLEVDMEAEITAGIVLTQREASDPNARPPRRLSGMSSVKRRRKRGRERRQRTEKPPTPAKPVETTRKRP